MGRESGRNMRLEVGLTAGAAPQQVPYMSEYTIDSDTEKFDVTAGGDGNKVYVVGLADFSGSTNGFVNAGLAVAADPLWLASRDGEPRHFRLYPNSVTGTAPVSTINNKALTNNVATLTTAAAHTLLVGQGVTVAGVDATFDGAYIITAVTGTTFSYAKTAANVVSAAATGTATGPNSAEHFWGQAYFSRSEGAGVGSARTVTSKITAAGTVNRTP